MNVIAIFWFVVYVLNFIAPSTQVLNLFSYFLWMATVVYFFKKEVQFSFLNFMVIFAYTTTGLSCLFAEFGSYYVETQTISFLTGATARNLSLGYFLLYGSFLGFSFIRKYLPETYPRITILNTVISKLTPLFAIALILGLFFISIKYGSPNDYNVDRFYYWTNIAPSWGDYLKFNLVQISFILGMLYSVNSNKIIMGLFALGLISQVLVGEKFTGIFTSIIFFITPYFIIHHNKFRFLSAKNIFLSVVVVSIFCLVIYSSYAALVGEKNASESFMSRIILQSQMWWTVDSISDGMKPLSEIIKSFLGLSTEERDKGIFYLMSQITPLNIFEGYYEKKINFTMASPVNIIYFFGYGFSLFIAIPIGFLCGIMLGIFRIAVINSDYWIVLLFVKIQYTIVRIFTMGEMYAFSEPKFLILCLLALSYALFVCLMKRSEKKYAL
ncbi:hypothetical protein D782_1592 [Enterobacteriaceae bacterium strain FGI 57]|nr:hypothetical protein D782_1592 [Enterobacteriaceae bacterium strain FGI 57]